MERFKSFWVGMFGMVIGFLFIMCAIGSVGYLIADGHYIFAVATLVTVIFAAKPVKDFFVKSII